MLKDKTFVWKESSLVLNLMHFSI